MRVTCRIPYLVQYRSIDWLPKFQGIQWLRNDGSWVAEYSVEHHGQMILSDGEQRTRWDLRLLCRRRLAVALKESSGYDSDQQQSDRR